MGGSKVLQSRLTAENKTCIICRHGGFRSAQRKTIQCRSMILDGPISSGSPAVSATNGCNAYVEAYAWVISPEILLGHALR